MLIRKRRMFPRAVVGIALSLFGCDADEITNLGAVPDVAFSTDATGYVAVPIDPPTNRHQFTVITRFQNRGTAPVYLGRCYPNSTQPMYGVVLANGEGESAYAQVWACVGHNQQFMMMPGQTRIDTLTIAGPNSFPSGSPTGFGQTSGHFRVLMDVRLALGDGAKQAPDSVRLSNEFVVTVKR